MPRPRVAFIEWVEPLMAGGNWMPELIEIAGGHNLFGAGRQAFRLDAVGRAGRRRPRRDRGGALRLWPRALPQELPLLQAKPGWAELAAVRNGRVYFADGNAYFNRPGPRLADSAEMLAEMLHPQIVEGRHRDRAWMQRI